MAQFTPAPGIFIRDFAELNLRFRKAFAEYPGHLDGRPSFAQCTCPFFNYNRLREGACQHMVALILKADSA
jgi:hypothetical protein